MKNTNKKNRLVCDEKISY